MNLGQNGIHGRHNYKARKSPCIHCSQYYVECSQWMFSLAHFLQRAMTRSCSSMGNVCAKLWRSLPLMSALSTSYQQLVGWSVWIKWLIREKEGTVNLRISKWWIAVAWGTIAGGRSNLYDDLFNGSPGQDENFSWRVDTCKLLRLSLQDLSS